MNEEELRKAYEELVQKYNMLANEFMALQQDNIVKRIEVLCRIFENSKAYSKEVLDLVDWHLKQLLAKNDERRDSETSN